MKLRISCHSGRGDSIRLRLSRSEVARFSGAGRIEETLAFPGGARLTYALESGDVPAPSASFDGSAIRIALPRTSVTRWAAADEVGISGDCFFDGRALQVLVEKDFQCVHTTPDPDAYPNPQRATGDEAA